MSLKAFVRRISQDLMPFDMGFLTARFVEKAEEELRETQEIRDKCLAELSELLKNETNLVCRSDDMFLLQFLRAAKFDVNKAFSRIKKFYTFKKKNKDIYTYKDGIYELLQKILSKGIFGFLPYRDKDGCAIFVVKIGNWNPSEVSIEEMLNLGALLFSCSIEDPVTQVTGYQVIIDCKNQSIGQLRYFTPYYAYLAYYSSQECFPGRFKGFHIMNQTNLYKLAFSFIQPFMSEKLKKRVHLHGRNLDSLHDHLPPSLLTTEYGGRLTGYDNHWVKKTISPEALKEYLKYGYK